MHAADWKSLGIETKYYNTNLHRGAFALPNYVQKLLEAMEELPGNDTTTTLNGGTIRSSESNAKKGGKS